MPIVSTISTEVVCYVLDFCRKAESTILYCTTVFILCMSYISSNVTDSFVIPRYYPKISIIPRYMIPFHPVGGRGGGDEWSESTRAVAVSIPEYIPYSVHSTSVHSIHLSQNISHSQQQSSHFGGVSVSLRCRVGWRRH